ncbi:U2 small nuclear ribonucleoprotein auxiliary factor 35 kDa subunit-related protein 2 isoform X1 [Myotis daubentonii]|uniref:U2 small nuclear ribonucleoprotein auxiliary factor 35 kDa subunit-related protein 2 isoform X1 n=1 Tax=Myotis daubentonii TaxID=98922 RepID=UPI00287357EB|nr:U2 small nuclear ribonucleoprotein auxiliary factor 35 kDa subunit-related protein 2 isoform X1 [Myotis daubentonii]
MVSRAVGGKRYLQAGIAILEKETFICAGFRKTSQRRPPPAFYVGCVWAEARPALRRDRRARGSSAAAQLRAPRSPPFPAGSCGRGGAGNMAAPRAVMLPDKLSHKKYRAALKKEKRKKRRQELARLRDSGLSQKKQEEEEESFIEQQEEKLLEIERQKLHEEWLLREQKAQEEFRIKKEKEEAARKRQEEQERKLKEEWEEQQRKEKEEEEQKLQEKREREEAVQKMLERAENELENSATWQNPEPPTDVRIMEKDRANCPFYSKTGACRFGDRCSRKHNFPTSSPTLLIRSMFTTFGMEQCRRDDYDPDASLEYSEEETYQQFLDFYEDVLPEFKNVGKVIQFKVYMKCSNAQEENTATFFTCSEIPTMNFGKLIGTSTCLQIGLALPLVGTQRGEREWATMMSTMAGPGGEEAPVRPVSIKEMENLRGKEVPTGIRSLTDTQQKVEKDTVHEVEKEKGTAVGAGAAGARATVAEAGAGAAVGVQALLNSEIIEGQVVETELFIVPNPNKLIVFLNDCICYLLWLLHTWVEGSEFKWISKSGRTLLSSVTLFKNISTAGVIQWLSVDL